MANLSSFGITVLLSASVPNPINSQSFQVVTPWGKSSVRSSLYEAFEDILFPGSSGGGPSAGVMAAYMQNQTLNGATGSGPTGFTNANEV